MATLTRTQAVDLSGRNVGSIIEVSPNDDTRVRGALLGVHHDTEVLLRTWAGDAWKTQLTVSLIIDKVGELTVYAGTSIDVESD